MAEIQKPKVVITIGQSNYKRMINDDALAELSNFAEIVHHSGNRPAQKADLIFLLRNAEACITSWGVGQFDLDVISAAPYLKTIVNMCGSVKALVSDALW